MAPPDLSAQYLAQLQTSDLPTNDEQLVAYHTAVHYSQTPENPDSTPHSPALFHAAQGNTAPTQQSITLAPLVISLPTAYAFVNATLYKPTNPGPTLIEEEWDHWETQTIADPDTPMNPPAALPETSDHTLQARFDDFLDYIHLLAMLGIFSNLTAILNWQILTRTGWHHWL